MVVTELTGVGNNNYLIGTYYMNARLRDKTSTYIVKHVFDNIHST